MSRLLLAYFFLVIASVTVILVQCELPADPSENPDNAAVILFTENGVVGHGVVNITEGDSSKIGLKM